VPLSQQPFEAPQHAHEEELLVPLREVTGLDVLRSDARGPERRDGPMHPFAKTGALGEVGKRTPLTRKRPVDGLIHEGLMFEGVYQREACLLHTREGEQPGEPLRRRDLEAYPTAITESEPPEEFAAGGHIRRDHELPCDSMAASDPRQGVDEAGCSRRWSLGHASSRWRLDRRIGGLTVKIGRRGSRGEASGRAGLTWALLIDPTVAREQVVRTMDGLHQVRKPSMKTFAALVIAGTVAFTAARTPEATVQELPDWLHFDIDDVRAERAEHGRPWQQFMQVPDLFAGLYEIPVGGEDGQAPHDADEVYYVLGGTAVAIVEGERIPVAEGSVLYVAKDKDHRFVDITSDLSLLVFFATAAQE